MLKKLVSIMLTVLIVIYMAVPIYAENTAWVRCNVSENSQITIEWGSNTSIREIRIYRSGDIFKRFTVGVPNQGTYAFTETEDGIYTYKVVLYGEHSIELASSDTYSVKGTGEPKIWLDFVDANIGATSVARIKNWVNIYNIGTTDLELSKLMIRYFYTIDGEPSAVNDKYPNEGQQKAEESDGKINPMIQYTEYPLERKNIQVKESIRMNFVKTPFNVMNENNIVADYVCETYFEGTTEKVTSAYCLNLQPAFDKKNLTNPESETIRNYNLINDFSYKNNNHIAVYYDNKKIWGLDPTIVAPRNLKGEYKDFKIELDWDDSPGANGYTVYRSESRDGEFKKIAVNIPQSNYTDTNIELPNQSVDKIYYYKVVAHYDKLVSEDSEIVGVPVTEFKAPTNLTANNINNVSVMLNWNGTDGATGYNVYRSESLNGPYEKINTQKVKTEIFVDNISGNTEIEKTYYYTVTAVYNNEIESKQSNSASVTIYNVAAPTNLKAEIESFKNVKLSWTASQNANSYNVYRSKDSGAFVKIYGGIVGTSFIDNTTELDKNPIVYHYKVVAVYKGIESNFSNVADAQMPVLAAPTNLKAELSCDKKVNLTWNASQGALSYNIYRSESPNGLFSKIITISAINYETGASITSYTDDSIPNVKESVGKKYYYKIVAAYNDKTSDDSNIADVTVYISGSNDYWYWNCRIISNKGRTDFDLGTYIPVSFTITLKQDIENPTIILEDDLINTKTHKLKASLVSNTNPMKLIKATLTNSLFTNKDIVSSYVSITEQKEINIDNKSTFKKGDVIYVEFALKTSAGSDVIADGINKYYNDKYGLDFIIRGVKGEAYVYQRAVDADGNRLTATIEKPDKLK